MMRRGHGRVWNCLGAGVVGRIGVGWGSNWLQQGRASIGLIVVMWIRIDWMTVVRQEGSVQNGL